MPRMTPAATEAAPAPVAASIARVIHSDTRPESPLCGEAIEGDVTCGRYAGHKKGPHRPSSRADLRAGVAQA